MGETKVLQNTNKQFLTILRIIFIASICFVGTFYEIASAVISGGLFVLLIWRASKGIRIKINIAFISVCVLVLFYFLSALWAVDSGVALWGGVKYLPVLLFALCLMQITSDERKVILFDIPWIGAIVTLLTFLLQFIPALSNTFTFNDRLGGSFQYPNPFACLLLIGFIILLFEDNRPKWMQAICGCLLLFGIIQSGTRAVFMMAVPAIIIALIIRRNIYTTFITCISVFGGCIASVLASLLTSLSGTWRVFTGSGESLSLLRRLLYWQDALPVIGEHPFGLGYYGYSFMQGSFQTGSYSVNYVHNDLLQLLLDVGWIPVILLCIAIVWAVCSKRSNAWMRLTIIVLIVHCLMDYDLEFVSMYFVLLLFMDWDFGREINIRIPIPASVSVSSVFFLFSLYMGITTCFGYSHMNQNAIDVYPWNTVSEARVLRVIGDYDEMERISDDILSRNQYVAEAWEAKALIAYDENDLDSVVAYGRKAISTAKYTLKEYENFFFYLSDMYYQYIESNDIEKAEICLSEIRSIDTMLEELTDKESNITKRLSDQPDMTMPDEYYEFLEVNS